MVMVRWRWLGTALVFLLGSYGIAWGWISLDALDGKCEYKQNALWISVDWTSTPPQRATIEALAEQVQTQQVRYLYPYVSYLKADGAWSQSYDHAHNFLTAYKSLDPDTKLLAWIGIPLKNPAEFGVQGWVELDEVVTRTQIAAFAGEMIALGFDGVHLNVESVRNDNAAFLALLEETRAVIGDDAVLSIAGAHWVVAHIGQLPVVGSLGWQAPYYREVARRVDQIATMTYDSHMPTSALYRLWTREQVRGVLASLAGIPVELLWGVSVSDEHTSTHKPEAENLASGLAGICAGVETGQHSVAIYAAWEMTEADRQEVGKWH